MAGTLRAEANLAVANGLFLVLLFLGGMAYPLEQAARRARGRRQAAAGRGAVGERAGGAHTRTQLPGGRARRARSCGRSARRSRPRAGSAGRSDGQPFAGCVIVASCSSSTVWREPLDDVAADDAVGVDEERLRAARDAVARAGRASSRRSRSATRRAVPRRTARASDSTMSCGVDADERDVGTRTRRVVRKSGNSSRHGCAPRRPEVQDDRLAAVVGEARPSRRRASGARSPAPRSPTLAESDLRDLTVAAGRDRRRSRPTTDPRDHRRPRARRRPRCRPGSSGPVGRGGERRQTARTRVSTATAAKRSAR